MPTPTAPDRPASPALLRSGEHAHIAAGVHAHFANKLAKQDGAIAKPATPNGNTPPHATRTAAPTPGAEYHFGTRLIHSGSEASSETGAVIPAISLSTTYKQSAVGVHKGFEYTRSLNPNRLQFETLIASLELPTPLSPVSASGGSLPPALAFASGSAVTQAIVTSLVPPGGHIVSVGDVYGGTYRYFTKVAAPQGIKTDFVHVSIPDGVEFADMKAIEATLTAAFKPETKLVWVETPTNPTLSMIDIALVARVAHAHGALVVVDNTFLSPYYQQPLRLGADIVVHSVTKYINGHSDVIMGVLVTPHADVLAKLRFYQNAGGAVPGSHDSWLAQRGAKTLALRMAQHGANALAIARWLATQDWVRKVFYPGLEGVERTAVRELAWRQLSPVARDKIIETGYTAQAGFPYGGMVSFYLDTRKLAPTRPAVETSSRFLASLDVFTLAESLGGVESLAELPSVMTHASVSAEDRAKLGIDDELIRLSVGIEDVRDLQADLVQAVEAATQPE